MGVAYVPGGDDDLATIRELIARMNAMPTMLHESSLAAQAATSIGPSNRVRRNDPQLARMVNDRLASPTR